jgi:hypothetical protein
MHAGMTGNSFTNWGKITPRHNAFLQAILQAPVHIISTLRTKQDYVLSEKNGKMVPEKEWLLSLKFLLFKDIIDGHTLSLMVGGVKAYNLG